MQKFVSRLLTLIVLNILALAWKEVNVVVAEARASGKDQGTKIKALGGFGPVQIWIELDGKAWNICIGAFSDYITARLTNGAWAFNKKTCEALYAHYDQKYGASTESVYDHLVQWVDLAVGGMVTPLFGIIDRLTGKSKTGAVTLGNTQSIDNGILGQLIRIHYVGTKGITGKENRTFGAAISGMDVSGLLGNIIDAGLDKTVMTSNETKELKEDLVSIYMNMTARPSL